MSIEPPGPVTMAELEQTDPELAAKVRRARRAEDAERIKNLARQVQQAAAAKKAPAPVKPPNEEPEPNWR